MSYLIGSGYITNERSYRFSKYWLKRLRNYATGSTRLVIVSVNSSRLPPWFFDSWIDTISLNGNLGHIAHLLNGAKPYTFCGWSMSVLTLALLAYQDESDLVFIEQDCLPFGDIIGRMYTDMGDGDMVFGKKQESPPYMPCAQSLFMIRHGFIPSFLGMYLAMGDERRLNSDGKPDNLPEDKFTRVAAVWPTKVRYLSFGVDRERPLPFDSEVWYAQQLSDSEINEIKTKGLL